MRGDPERPLRWVSKCLRHICDALSDQGFSVSHTLVSRFLKRRGYTLQGNVKIREGADPPDRDAQFHHINEQVAAFAEGRTAGDLRGYQEEGTGGGFQEFGP